MTASKIDTPSAWVDPDDAPELSDEWFDRADLKIGDKVVRRGRPKGSSKQAISIRIDADILTKFKAGGAGWQSRINDALRKAV